MNINIASELREKFEGFQERFLKETNGRCIGLKLPTITWKDIPFGFGRELIVAYSRFDRLFREFRGCDVRYGPTYRLRYPNDHLVYCRRGSSTEANMNDWDRAQFQEMHAVMDLFDEILDWFRNQYHCIIWYTVSYSGWSEFNHPRDLYELVGESHFRKTVRYYLFSLIASNNAKVTAARRKSIMDGVQPVTRGNPITRAINLGSNTMRRAMEFVVEARDGI